MTELAKAYEAKKYEDDIYKRWESSGLFNPDVCLEYGITNKQADSYTIILPPPNVTGQLHLGHASMLAYEDLLIRYNRLLGKQTLWLPGTDHAAIATQTVVEKQLAKEGKKKEDLGREKFLEKVKEYVAGSTDTIHRQIRKIGASLDWSREKYTLDQDVSQVVFKVFKEMYEDGLIYRGNRIVNWCPRCQSTLADDEVEYREEKSPFYYFKYGPVVIGTARPETKFADKVIVVHPDDKRYQDMIGKKFTVPWIEGEIEAQVIADPASDPEMGTGAMTITPAHSFVDFELAQKYKLEIKKIIDEQGNLTQEAGQFAGQNANQARTQIIAKMQEQGLVDHIEDDYVHNLSVCYRCNTPIEPLVSDQWFIDVNKKVPKLKKTLKEISLEVIREGLDGQADKKIEIIPERFNKTYFHWMENLRDWCISRQIWWGHRIPVWYRGEDKKEIYVGVDKPEGDDWIQDEDTLDTWFSSALWTFSTLGWPNSDDFKRFHPTQVLETGYDILFFWVARMILMTTYMTGDIPFEKVYLHGLIRDKQGKKMSKSLGNGIDPIEMIDKFGADALRLSMIIGTSAGNDIKMYEEKIAGYRNFVNKLWNISRFVLMTVSDVNKIDKLPQARTLADQWIVGEFNKLISEVSGDLESYNFSQAAEKLYEFTWSKLADWYLEIAKIEKDKDDILNYILSRLLIMWHPFTPFVTEAIWNMSYNQKQSDKEMLLIQKWPVVEKLSKSQNSFDILQEIVIRIRNLRAEAKIDPGKIIDITIRANDRELFINQKIVIEKLARVKLELIADSKKLKQDDYIKWAGSDYELFMQVGGEVKQRIEQEKKQLEKYIKTLERKFTNKSFINKAPREVVKNEECKLAGAKEKLSKL